MKLRIKFLLSISLLILMVIGVIVIVVNHLEERSILEDREISAFDLVYVLAHSSVQAIVADDYLVLQEILDSVHSKKDIIQAMILDNDGNILVHNDTRLVGHTLADALSTDAIRANSERSVRIQHGGTTPAWDVSVPVMILNKKVGTARIIFSLESAYSEIAKTRNTVLTIGAFAFLSGIFLSMVLGRIIARPLYKLVDATRRIGKGDLSYRVRIDSGDEIGELAKAFDQMIEGLVERDTQLEEKMAQLSELSSYNENILQSMSSGVITVDLRGSIVTLNKSAEKITGLMKDDVKGKDVRSIVSFDPSFRDIIFKALSSGKEIRNIEVKYKNLQDRKLTLQVNTRLLKTFEGKTIGVLTVFNDLTEIKKLEEDMKRAERLATLGTTAASIAHEVRTPLTSLSTFTELLPIKYNDPKFRKRFQAIVPAQVDRLINLVNDLLDFSRVETLHFQDTQINTIVKEAADVLAEKTSECGVRMDLDLASNLPVIRVDREHISQVFLNVIQNALQAMPDGGELKIASAYADYDASQCKDTVERSLYPGFVEISFSDNGFGIAEENMEKLFEPFFSTRSKGTGLGLAISYRIVKDHGGSIQVRSEVGRGTTFVIFLPKRTQTGEI
ncbi:MAG: HAMP domain-containing protein [Gemmatimonadota bacterium]|nr:MAG: HAMP domain-containing protein [Gemmatimonadota bacterium]